MQAITEILLTSGGEPSFHFTTVFVRWCMAVDNQLTKLLLTTLGDILDSVELSCARGPSCR